jgi:hypothetical protein
MTDTTATCEKLNHGGHGEHGEESVGFFPVSPVPPVVQFSYTASAGDS